MQRNKDDGGRVRSKEDQIQFNLPGGGKYGIVSSHRLGFWFENFKSTANNVSRTHLFIGKPDTEENRASFVSTIPLGRGSTPKDIANAVAYLASDEAEFITGVNLEVDGGRCV